MQKRDINAELAPQPASAYSQAVEVTGGARILFISGQLSTEADGTTPPGMAEQARLAWRNLAAQLAAAGMGFDNLVKVTMIIPDAAASARGARLAGISRWATDAPPAPLSSPASPIPPGKSRSKASHTADF